MDFVVMDYLEQQTTRRLLSLKERCYKCGGQYSPFDNENMVTIDQIKQVLATREHVPNKQEAKQLRRANAKRGR